MAARRRGNLDIVRRLLTAGVQVEAEAEPGGYIALHNAVCNADLIAIPRELIRHNVLAVGESGLTPSDSACNLQKTVIPNFSIEIYRKKVAQVEGGLAVHALLIAARYLLVVDGRFHPPLNPLRIRSQLGKLRFHHFHTLLHSWDIGSIRNRDDHGNLPIHIGC